MENIGKTGEILAGDSESGVLRLHVDTSTPVKLTPEGVSSTGKTFTFAATSGYGESSVVNIGGVDWNAQIGVFVRLLPQTDEMAREWLAVAESREGYIAPSAKSGGKARRRL